MSKYEQQHYKETTPENTVEKLLQILQDCGIELEEHWVEESSINTQSLRVTIRGTNIGTNGKGVTRAYARASAYAEFFERFQNGVLNQYLKEECTPYVIARDEVMLPIEDLLDGYNPFLDHYFSLRNMSMSSKSEKEMSFRKINVPNKDGRTYVSLPFYSLRAKKVIYLPFFTYMIMYGSNGMCAGNTPAEAIVQGLSEIFERLAQKRIFEEKTALPVIPDDYIKKYPSIFEMYEKARSNSDYFVSLRDCSFGGKYPVAALLVVEKNTGRYGLKLGCHPNMGIAMERTFTEICQGNDIFEFARSRSWLDFTNANVDETQNITNSFKTGFAQYPYEIFSEKGTYDFTEMPDVSNLSNDELANKWLSQITKDYDVLIRDVSFTGFPSFHIIIPGLSELTNVSDYDLRIQNMRSYVCRLLLDPSSIDHDVVKYITATLRTFSKSVLENTLSSYYPSDVVLNLPCNEVSADYFLMMVCYIYQKDFLKAKECVITLRKRAFDLDVSQDTKNRLTAIYYYIVGRMAIGLHKPVMNYLKTFFDNEICQYLDNLFFDTETIINRLYSSVIIEKLPYYSDFLAKISQRYDNVKINQMTVGNFISFV